MAAHPLHKCRPLEPPFAHAQQLCLVWCAMAGAQPIALASACHSQRSRLCFQDMHLTTETECAHHRSHISHQYITLP